MLYRCERRDRIQSFVLGDLEKKSTFERFKKVLPERVDLVYSDPPWNPGNATYWRTHAGLDACASYEKFMDHWCKYVVLCIRRGAMDVFCEQSTNVAHQQYLVDAIERQPRWGLPLAEEWTVFYGSPGSASVRRPNHLFHYGDKKITTDPSGMAGEPMTVRVCAGLHLLSGSVVVDPCMGKGMISRMAHYFDWDCVGVEINPKRLARTIEWLSKQGYDVKEER